jgi:Mg/Co/Ni transporter MgtE
LDEHARARFAAALPPSKAESVSRLLAFEPDQAGSRMDPRAPAVSEHATVGQAIEAVRREPGGALYYVYVVSENYALRGVLNMRELLSADPDSRVQAVMTENPERIRAETPIESVLRHPAWLKVHALPVVDERGSFLGAIRYSAFRKIEAEAGRAPSGPDAARATSALADLFLLGAAAVARTAGGALLGSTAQHSRDS